MKTTSPPLATSTKASQTEQTSPATYTTIQNDKYTEQNFRFPIQTVPRLICQCPELKTKFPYKKNYWYLHQQNKPLWYFYWTSPSSEIHLLSPALTSPAHPVCLQLTTRSFGTPGSG